MTSPVRPPSAKRVPGRSPKTKASTTRSSGRLQQGGADLAPERDEVDRAGGVHVLELAGGLGAGDRGS
jgi:hypothetical protein